MTRPHPVTVRDAQCFAVALDAWQVERRGARPTCAGWGRPHGTRHAGRIPNRAMTASVGSGVDGAVPTA